MVTKRFSLLFRLKKPVHYVKGNMPIYMRITVDSQRTELSINREFDPDRWNTKAGRASGTKEDARALNAYLTTLQVKVFEVHREMVANGDEISSERLKNKLTGKGDERPRMLLEIFAEHNKQMAKLISTGEYAKGTLTHFETTYRHVGAFLRWKHNVADIMIQKVDYAFISDLEYYLKCDICAHNTTMKYLGDLRKILLLCVKRNWLLKDPFIGYKMSRREVQKDFLVDEELEAIAKKQFKSERLDLVRNIFLFSCYTGLAYADVKKLKRSEIRIGIDKQKWIFIQRQKSETAAAVPLLPIALSILEKYTDHPKCENSDLALPILCNQKMNEYLKEIADVCGIEKTLTYHTARHTFATTVTLNNNVPIESVSKMLGHKSLKQTQHYAKILNRKIADDMSDLRQKMLKAV
ncbi:MAG TPA: site-specific integrase [Flavisolibacter sp.]|nr:site-specific integrase [Flavisolibacter sp.]